jgi:hypothetical protein
VVQESERRVGKLKRAMARPGGVLDRDGHGGWVRGTVVEDAHAVVEGFDGELAFCVVEDGVDEGGGWEGDVGCG